MNKYTYKHTITNQPNKHEKNIRAKNKTKTNKTK